MKAIEEVPELPGKPSFGSQRQGHLNHNDYLEPYQIELEFD